MKGQGSQANPPSNAFGGVIGLQNGAFTTNGIAQRNHSELALWFSSGPPAHQLFRAPVAVGSLIANGKELLTDDPGTKAEGTDFAIPPISPYADNFELVGMTAFTEPLTLYQLQNV